MHARQAPAAAVGAATKSDSGGRPATRSSTMFGRSLVASLAAATAKDAAPSMAAASDAAPLVRTTAGSVSSSFARKVRGACWRCTVSLGAMLSLEDHISAVKAAILST